MRSPTSQDIGSTLPAGIRLAHDGRYAGMLSLKLKNYALLDHDGRMILEGKLAPQPADGALLPRIPVGGGEDVPERRPRRRP